MGGKSTPLPKLPVCLPHQAPPLPPVAVCGSHSHFIHHLRTRIEASHIVTEMLLKVEEMWEWEMLSSQSIPWQTLIVWHKEWYCRDIMFHNFYICKPHLEFCNQWGSHCIYVCSTLLCHLLNLLRAQTIPCLLPHMKNIIVFWITNLSFTLPIQLSLAKYLIFRWVIENRFP